jgi:tetratricopeptide (TPR) repeat protein
MGLTGERALDGRLSPAVAHDILRRRLNRLLVPHRLDPADARRLIRHLHIHIYDADEVIVPRGVRAGCFALIVQGQVVVHTGGRRDGQAEAILLPGSTFGQNMLLHGQPSRTTLQALSRCEIWFLNRAELQTLADDRQAARRTALLRRTWRRAGLLLALGLLAVLALSLPAVRPAVAVVPMSLGEWCGQRGYERCAIRSWNVAANLAPGDVNPFLALGNIYFEQGELAAAERSFEAVKALAPEAAEVYNNLGLIYAQQGEHERAVAAFTTALELQPGTAAVEGNLALSLQALEEYDEALDHYQAALALGEPETSTLVNLAITYYWVGQGARAAETAREALRRDPDLAPAYTVLGAVALENGRADEALPDLQRAISLDADYGQAYFFLGLACKSLNRTEEAILAFEHALATAGDEATRVRIRRHLNELYQAEERGTPP